METLAILKDTPVPTLLVLGGLVFLMLSIVNQVGGKIKVAGKRQNMSIAIGVILLSLGVVLYLVLVPGSNARAGDVPTITGVTIREETKSEGLVIYQEINFVDRDGNTNTIQWDLVDISDASQRQYIQIINGDVTALPDKQMMGAYALGTWYCEGHVYKITLDATLLDRSSNRSEPYRYSIECK